VTDTRATLLFTMPSLAASINATFHRLPTVYGQPGVTTASPNNPSAAAGGLNQPQGLEFDRSAARNVMYISDSGNHRGPSAVGQRVAEVRLSDHARGHRRCAHL